MHEFKSFAARVAVVHCRLRAGGQGIIRRYDCGQFRRSGRKRGRPGYGNSTTIVRSTVTNETGNFSFPLVDPGAYSLEASREGFKKANRSGITLDANSTVRVDFTLEVGSVSETIDVTASVAILQTDRADLGTKIERQTLANLPLTFNRNYQGLLGPCRAFPGPSGRTHRFITRNISLSTYVNGQFRQASSFMIEGINNDWDNGNLTVVVPSVEAIQTVDVTTGNYDAEFGRVTGAVTNVILKSGSNSIHGSAFEFNKVAALPPRITSPDYPAADLQPVRRDYQRTYPPEQDLLLLRLPGPRDREAAAIGTLTIPTLPFRNGDLSASPTQIYDPATGAADGRAARCFRVK